MFCISLKQHSTLFGGNQDAAFPLLGLQASAHAGHFQPTHHPPSACLLFNAGPGSLTQTFHRRARSGALKKRGRGMRRKECVQGGLMAISEYLSWRCKKGGQRQRGKTASRLCCIVWSWLPCYLYVSLLLRRKPLLLDPDVKRMDRKQAERRVAGGCCC